MGPCIVEHQNRLLALYILTLDFLHNLEQEFSEFDLVGRSATHEDWLVQAPTDGSEDGDKHHSAVYRDQHWLILHMPSFGLAN